MRASPRRVRQDKITLFTPIDKEFDVTYQTTFVDYVRVDENYGINQSAKGIEDTNSVLVVIDLNDLQAYGAEPVKDLMPLLIKGRTLVRLEHTDDLQNAFTLNDIKKDKPADNKPAFLELLLR
ncbi:hypothetical protein [Dielma fastidiosa]|jgi:hypothetical protein|uniref:hypothetical protein n=1 Tax=Dielma fastidiosa TaxID=1034346 RepID=UPI000D78ECDD|nr:hypothetical protein [Dielma fastidiosa]MBS6168600.1 hypothetical protein [Bacillota bacterium]PWM54040.1 MAG: hypothetical protein DBX92_14565 [Dielma fastidiosa]RHN01477.1 hypothetical protein DWZ33_05650 [Dielma fastidiosa]DAK73392.1 MAG TPA: hypothetical protein [Caudoviricetes sp.]